MLIKRTHPFTGETNSRDLPITTEELFLWESGELIQNVWPHLSADDREFIKTGITDWENCIPEYIGTHILERILTTITKLSRLQKTPKINYREI